MITEIIQWFIISLILIILVHHLYFFFKNTLSIPKTKDLINKPMHLYNEINSTISGLDSSSVEADANTIKLSTNEKKSVDLEINQKEMKDELKNFFQELNVNPSSTSQDLVYSPY